MITAWDIYWVMQLDSIKTLFTVASVVILIGLLMFPIWMMMLEDVCDDANGVGKRIAKWGAGSLLISAGIVAFLPSSRTAAAMIIIPKIANSETIQKEAGDLYQLAKDGLRRLVAPPEKKDVEK